MTVLLYKAGKCKAQVLGVKALKKELRPLEETSITLVPVCSSLAKVIISSKLRKELSILR